MNRKVLFIPLVLVLSACFTKKTSTTITNKQAQKNNQQIQKANGNSMASNTSLTSLQYIDRYKAIAIQEMNTYGIPASITLAQGLFESGSGNSELAHFANNHFGIKCTSDWTGKSYFKDDDHANDCFRVYDNAEESFRDHSRFLKRKNYATLYTLDKKDYKSWAYGLKKAGYATNPNYPSLLINLIQKYNLDQYDIPGEVSQASLKQAQINSMPNSPVAPVVAPVATTTTTTLVKITDTVRKTVVKTDTIKRTFIKTDTIKKVVYKTDTLKKTIFKTDTIQTSVVKTVTVKPAATKTVVVVADTAKHNTVKKDSIQVILPGKLYTVQKGDTLFNISKRFGLKVDELKALNNLNDSGIKIGQQLIIVK